MIDKEGLTGFSFSYFGSRNKSYIDLDISELKTILSVRSTKLDFSRTAASFQKCNKSLEVQKMKTSELLCHQVGRVL